MSQQRWILCEKPEDLQGRSGFVVYWASFQQGESALSIPARLEREGEVLQSEYLQWLHDLGRSEWRGCSIADHLAVRSDFSIWWMSLLVEKSQWKSPHLYNCFRLMAFERLLRDEQPASVEIAVNDGDVAEALATCCGNAGIPCHVEAFSASRSSVGIESLPHLLRAVLVLGRDLLQRWPQKRDDLAIEESSEIVIISYFFNVDWIG